MRKSPLVPLCQSGEFHCRHDEMGRGQGKDRCPGLKVSRLGEILRGPQDDNAAQDERSRQAGGRFFLKFADKPKSELR
jgi:hypothetical protein